MLATRAPDSHFHIISRDRGFDPLITHLREKQLHVGRSPTLADIPPLLKVTRQQALAHPAAVEANLLARGTSRPASVNTLKNTIKTLLPSTLPTTTAAETIIKEMQRRRDIVVESNKVSYHLKQA